MKKLTLENFVERALKIHGNKFDYSKVNYINNNTKIIIICKTCEKDFQQQPNNHLNGQGCPYCCGKIKWTNNEFIKKAIEINGNKYDYSLVQYKNNRTKIKIICRICNNVFEQTPQAHIHNLSGCPICAHIEHGINLRKSRENFIVDARQIHENRYDYSEVIYKDSNTKIIIKCTKCNINFEQLPSNHLSGKGCPRCAIGVSEPETDWLNSLYIPEEYRQKKIKIGNHPYFVDAYNPITNTIYEFYGDFWHGNPNVYDLKKINKKTNTTFQALYNRTIKKENALKSMGYNIISIWESDWNKLKAAS